MLITNLGSFFFHQIREAEQEVDRVYEPMIGIVTDNQDPDKLMRVKVKLPALSSEDQTWWVPVVSMGAGKDRGWFFLPEVDDEVLVAFEHGDINHPVVIGRLWNGKDAPPDTNGGSNERRVLVSRSGSRIELDDENNKITVKDGGGIGEVTFAADDNTLTMEAKSGDVVIQCPNGELQILVDGEISLKANQNLDIRSDGKTQLGAGSGLKLDGSGQVAITAGAVDLNPGGVPDAKEASTSPEETPDPV